MSPVLLYGVALLGGALCLTGVLRDAVPNRCEMTWSRPIAQPVTLPATNSSAPYSFYRLFDHAAVAQAPKGQPLLFIPGNMGSFRQARSIVSQLNRRLPNTFDFFAADFGEHATAASTHVIEAQASYLADAVGHLAATYANQSLGRQLVVVAHSMGSAVMQRALQLQVLRASDAPALPVALYVNLAAPHASWPLYPDDHATALREAIAASARELLAETVFLNVAGGARDQQVLTRHTAVAARRSASMTTAAMHPDTVEADHLAILWCAQPLGAIADAVVACVDPSNGTLLASADALHAALQEHLAGASSRAAEDLQGGFVDAFARDRDFAGASQPAALRLLARATDLVRDQAVPAALLAAALLGALALLGAYLREHPLGRAAALVSFAAEPAALAPLRVLAVPLRAASAWAASDFERPDTNDLPRLAATCADPLWLPDMPGAAASRVQKFARSAGATRAAAVALCAALVVACLGADPTAPFADNPEPAALLAACATHAALAPRCWPLLATRFTLASVACAVLVSAGALLLRALAAVAAPVLARAPESPAARWSRWRVGAVACASAAAGVAAFLALRSRSAGVALVLAACTLAAQAAAALVGTALAALRSHRESAGSGEAAALLALVAVAAAGSVPCVYPLVVLPSPDDGWLTSDLLKACAAWAPLCAWALALAAGPRAPRVDAPAATPRPTPTPAAPATPHASLRHGACTQCFHEDGGPSCIYEETGRQDVTRLRRARVSVGPEFRVVHCTCPTARATRRDRALWCDFCTCACRACGGGPGRPEPEATAGGGAGTAGEAPAWLVTAHVVLTLALGYWVVSLALCATDAPHPVDGLLGTAALAAATCVSWHAMRAQLL